MNVDSAVMAAGEARSGVFRRVLPTAVAIVPVSMLFGVLASRADWSLLEVLLISLLGFSGSGQFALLPLASSGAGFFTMLLLTASINSRYLPIAYTSSGRLPRSLGKKILTAHMLGDEAYATENERDTPGTVVAIRATIFTAWVLAAVAGALLGTLIPPSWIGRELNLAYPASVVLMYLSIAQLRQRLAAATARRLPALLAVGLSVAVALALIALIGPVYFWIPSVLIASVLLKRGLA
jgi:predicted branched-subunit amino acid permease